VEGVEYSAYPCANALVANEILFAAVHESEVGTKRTSSDVRLESVVGGKADYMGSE
jgi:hypothetical protein